VKRFVRKITLTLISGGFAILSASVTHANEGSGYQPPEVPKYYVDGDGGYQQPVAVKKNYVYLEPMGALGMSQPTGSGAARLSYGFDLKLGYVKALGSWSHIETSIGYMSHFMASTPTELRVPAGVMLQVGYGYSIFGSMRGVTKVGAGAIFSRYYDNVNGYESTALAPGFALQFGYNFLVPISERILVDVGPAWTRSQSFVKDVKTPKGDTLALNESFVFNAFEVQIGLRCVL
jgi:hypothetical protein